MPLSGSSSIDKLAAHKCFVIAEISAGVAGKEFPACPKVAVQVSRRGLGGQSLSGRSVSRKFGNRPGGKTVKLVRLRAVRVFSACGEMS